MMEDIYTQIQADINSYMIVAGLFALLFSISLVIFFKMRKIVRKNELDYDYCLKEYMLNTYKIVEKIEKYRILEYLSGIVSYALFVGIGIFLVKAMALCISPNYAAILRLLDLVKK